MATTDKANEAIVYEFSHPIDQVYQALTSREFLEERANWVQTDDVEIKEIQSTAGGGSKAVVDRYVHRNYPRAFKGLFPDRQHMDNVENFVPDGAGGYKLDYVCDVTGAPVLVEAEGTLKSTGGGCELRALHTITVKIPMIGKRVEKYVMGQTKSQYRDQLFYLDLKLDGTSNLLPRDTNKYPVPSTYKDPLNK